MHIALCGPITLLPFQRFFDEKVLSTGYPFPGTSALVMRYLERGHRVSIVTTGSDIAELKTYESPALNLYIVPARKRARDRALDFFLSERRGIRNVLEDIQPDVIHAHWTYEFGLAARATKYPSLVTVHDWAPTIARCNKHLYWYFRAVMQARCLISRGSLSAPTQYIARRVAKLYRKRIVTIPNGIDLTSFREQRVSGPVRIGMLNVGFSSLKNVTTALKAWKIVFENNPDVVLHLAGPSYETGGDAERWARSQNLHHGVVFEGPIANEAVPGWFADKTLFLHASLEESFGIVLIEAMAAGVPVVAGAKSGAVADVTGGAAVLTDVRSPQALADSIEELLAGPALRADLSRRGIERAQLFDEQAVADAYLRELNAIRNAARNSSAGR